MRDPSALPQAPCVPPRPMPWALRPFPSPEHGTRSATEAPRPTQDACYRAEALAHRSMPVMPTAASYVPTLYVPPHPVPHTSSLATRSACRTSICAHRNLPRRMLAIAPRTPCPMGHTLTTANLDGPQSTRRARRAAPRPVRLGAPRDQSSLPRPISGAPRPRCALPASPRPARRSLLCISVRSWPRLPEIHALLDGGCLLTIGAELDAVRRNPHVLHAAVEHVKKKPTGEACNVGHMGISMLLVSVRNLHRRDDAQLERVRECHASRNQCGHMQE